MPRWPRKLRTLWTSGRHWCCRIDLRSETVSPAREIVSPPRETVSPARETVSERDMFSYVRPVFFLPSLSAFALLVTEKLQLVKDHCLSAFRQPTAFLQGHPSLWGQVVIGQYEFSILSDCFLRTKNRIAANSGANRRGTFRGLTSPARQRRARQSEQSVRSCARLRHSGFREDPQLHPAE